MHQGPVPMPDLLPRSESLALSSKARAQERIRREWARIPRIPWARIPGAISLGRVGRLAICGHTTGYASRMDAAQTHAPRERHLGCLPRQIVSGCAERNGGSGSLARGNGEGSTSGSSNRSTTGNNNDGGSGSSNSDNHAAAGMGAGVGNSAPSSTAASSNANGKRPAPGSTAAPNKKAKDGAVLKKSTLIVQCPRCNVNVIVPAVKVFQCLSLIHI